MIPAIEPEPGQTVENRGRAGRHRNPELEVLADVAGVEDELHLAVRVGDGFLAEPVLGPPRKLRHRGGELPGRLRREADAPAEHEVLLEIGDDETLGADDAGYLRHEDRPDPERGGDVAGVERPRPLRMRRG